MFNLFKVDIENCINSVRFKIAFFILFALGITHYIFSLKYFYGFTSDIIPTFHSQGMIQSISIGRSLFGLFISLMPLVILSIYSDSYYIEKKNNTHVSIVSRCGTKQYILSKVLTCAVVSFCTIFFVMFINELLSYIAFNGVGTDTGMGPYYGDNAKLIDLLGEFGDENIILGKLIIILINSIYAAIISVLGLLITFVFNVKNYVMIIGVFIFDYILDIVIPITVGFKYSMTLMRQGGGESVLCLIVVLIIWSIALRVLSKIAITKELIE